MTENFAKIKKENNINNTKLCEKVKIFKMFFLSVLNITKREYFHV